MIQAQVLYDLQVLFLGIEIDSNTSIITHVYNKAKDIGICINDQLKAIYIILDDDDVGLYETKKLIILIILINI